MRRAPVRALARLLILLIVPAAAAAATLPRGYWTLEQADPLLAKTAEVRLEPDLSALTPGERAALDKLIEVGRIMDALYVSANHRQALEAHERLAGLDKRLKSPAETRALLDIERLFQGPIATTLDNRRVPFLPVDSLVPGKNVYPWGIEKGEIERWLASHPEEREAIVAPRTVVRRAEPALLRADLVLLSRHPALRVLHPDLEPRLRALAARPPAGGFYAIPYALAHAEPLHRASRLLMQAASDLRRDDPDLARYLEHRARDFLANDYEAGDAAWVTGRFRLLNAQIGAYESYDDEIYGAKAFHSASLMLEDRAASAEARRALEHMQEFERSLPYTSTKRVRPDIPLGIYDVIADFGQARGTNTASILPNEEDIVRRHGRTILMRRNILVHPVPVASAKAAWLAAVAPAHAGEFDPQGTLYRVMWHEVGHYLGPAADPQGRPLEIALQEESGTFEEMKADLVSLYLAKALRVKGFYDERRVRSVYASGIGRTLQKSRPRRDQVYGTMQLMQMNWFLDRGVLAFDPQGKLRIRYDRYHDAVASLLREVLAIQAAGDRAAGLRFIDRWATWGDRHEALARAMRAEEPSRFRLVRYAALGE